MPYYFRYHNEATIRPIIREFDSYALKIGISAPYADRGLVLIAIRAITLIRYVVNPFLNRLVHFCGDLFSKLLPRIFVCHEIKRALLLSDIIMANDMI